MSAPVPRPRRVRPEIQALRALAVALVLFYHLWPHRLPGGFVGVDVFFVISGFLITAHLLREVETTGRIRLGRFWARRARRLLPASLLVIAASGIATWLVVPASSWQQFFREMLAATFYVENWVLAGDAVDYSAAEGGASPVQHYWSLSVEEQFYLAWPLLILAAVLLSIRLSPVGRRRMIGLTLAVITVVSLTLSIWWTARDPGAAYFVTPTRAWEFGTGGLLAVAGQTLNQWSERRRGALSWTGLCAIAASALLYSSATPFPSWTAALPVLGTAAVIAAGEPRVAWSPVRLGALRPVQYLGDISYAVYLWHWPLIVILPFALGRGLGTLELVAVLIATILLAALSTRFVERPVRESIALGDRHPWRVLLAAAVAMCIAAALPTAGTVQMSQRAAASAQLEEQLIPENIAPSTGSESVTTLIAAFPECFGALATLEAGCSNPELEGALVPDPAVSDLEGYAGSCLVRRLSEDAFRVCEFGVDPEQAVRTVALVGDSHAQALIPALDLVAKSQSWNLVTILRGSCPFTAAERAVSEPTRTHCRAWSEQVLAEVEQRPEISVLFVSASASNGYVTDPGTDSTTVGIEGARSIWSRLPETVTRVVALRDVPRARADVVQCAVTSGLPAALDPASCGSPADAVIYRDPLAEAAQLAADAPSPDEEGRDFGVVDLTDVFCTDGFCSAVIGNVMVYRDGHHLTPAFSRTLAPLLLAQLESLGVTSQ